MENKELKKNNDYRDALTKLDEVIAVFRATRRAHFDAEVDAETEGHFGPARRLLASLSKEYGSGDHPGTLKGSTGMGKDLPKSELSTRRSNLKSDRAAMKTAAPAEPEEPSSGATPNTGPKKSAPQQLVKAAVVPTKALATLIPSFFDEPGVRLGRDEIIRRAQALGASQSLKTFKNCLTNLKETGVLKLAGDREGNDASVYILGPKFGTRS